MSCVPPQGRRGAGSQLTSGGHCSTSTRRRKVATDHTRASTIPSPRRSSTASSTAPPPTCTAASPLRRHWRGLRWLPIFLGRGTHGRALDSTEGVGEEQTIARPAGSWSTRRRATARRSCPAGRKTSITTTARPKNHENLFAARTTPEDPRSEGRPRCEVTRRRRSGPSTSHTTRSTQYLSHFDLIPTILNHRCSTSRGPAACR